MSENRFGFGDRVRHRLKPEWGIGSVVKAELAGDEQQRVSIRFPGAGLKTLHTAQAELEHVEEEAAPAPEDETPHVVAVWAERRESTWLAPVAERKIQEAIVALPADVRDPFRSLRARMESAFRLYRFDKTGRGLIDWAVAQTGLDDPLSRFTRQELEQYFDRWVHERDAHLAQLIRELQGQPELAQVLLAEAPKTAQAAVRRLAAVR